MVPASYNPGVPSFPQEYVWRGAPEAQGPWGKLGTHEFYDIGTIVAGKSGGKVFRDPL